MGETYIRNAEDALDREVKDEDQLYIWENQLATIDEFLADSEMLDGDDDLVRVRAEAREAKTKLEESIAGFFGDPLEADDEETNVGALLSVGAQLMDEAEEVLDKDDDSLEHADMVETSLLGLKQWLADSEPYQEEHKIMAQARRDVRMAKEALEIRRDEIVSTWKDEDGE